MSTMREASVRVAVLGYCGASVNRASRTWKQLPPHDRSFLPEAASAAGLLPTGPRAFRMTAKETLKAHEADCQEDYPRQDRIEGLRRLLNLPQRVVPHSLIPLAIRPRNRLTRIVIERIAFIMMDGENGDSAMCRPTVPATLEN